MLWIVFVSNFIQALVEREVALPSFKNYVNISTTTARLHTHIIYTYINRVLKKTLNRLHILGFRIAENFMVLGLDFTVTKIWIAKFF